MLKLSNIKISADKKPDKDLLVKKTAKLLGVNSSHIRGLQIARLSVDARDKNDVFYVVSVTFDIDNENKFLKLKNVSNFKPFTYAVPEAKSIKRPVVVGFGPCGMFCALVLAKAGLNPIIAERGKSVDQRQADVSKFIQTGILDTQSNVQFGEGGAGTFSDGKLTTGIKDKRCAVVLEEFVKAGAPKQITYMAKPHIGTDNLVNIVKNIREQIIKLGGEVRFGTLLTDINIKNGRLQSVMLKDKTGEYEVETDTAVLAIGHSARDTFKMLHSKGILMEKKPFAVGVRIEHLQSRINTAQYGRFAKYLPAADYKLAAHLPNGRGAYTFCMCPGGVVAAAASEENRLVTNGMSCYSRNGKNANSALLIGVNPSDFGDGDELSGISFQRNLESRAYKAGGGGYLAPVQLVGDILSDRASTGIGDVVPTYKPGVTPTDLRFVFPEFIYSSIKMGIMEMDKKINGFADKSAVLTAVESRSSSPVRILRGEDISSLSCKGLYPCGEGCGYAGGIMSAAVDGIRCGEEILQGISSKKLFSELIYGD